MTVAFGVSKRLRFKEESTWGTAAADNDTTYTRKALRRVQSTLDLSKDVYQSNEMRDDYQMAVAAHGVRRVQGNIAGEFSPYTYGDFIGATLRNRWSSNAAFVSETGSELAFATTTTITRAAGSWVADGFKVGATITVAGSAEVGNNATHTITAVTSTTITCSGSTFTVAAGATGVSVRSGVAFAAATGSELTTTTSTIARAAGSWLSDGFKLGDIIRIKGHVTTANNNINLRITGITALTITVAGTPLTQNSTGDVTAVVHVVGSKLWAPRTGHLDRSFTIEHYFSDLDESEYFVGCKIGSMGLSLPSTGISNVQFGIMGKDMLTASGGAAPYFTSVADESSTQVLTAVNGVLRIGSSDVALLTGMQISVDGGMSSEPVVGSNTVPVIAQGRVRVSGRATILFEDTSFRDAFINETEVSVIATLNAGSGASADVVTIKLPRVKFNGASKDDGEKSLVGDFPFAALIDTSAGAGTSTEDSTIVFQDTTSPD